VGYVSHWISVEKLVGRAGKSSHTPISTRQPIRIVLIESTLNALGVFRAALAFDGNKNYSECVVSNAVCGYCYAETLWPVVYFVWLKRRCLATDVIEV